MLDFLIRLAATAAFLLITVGGGLTIGMVAEEVDDRVTIAAADAVRADRDYPPANPSNCQREALAAVRSQLPGLDIQWRWADLDSRGAVGTAMLRSRIVMLDPDLACAEVASTAYHEWIHIATVEVYGGPGALTGTVTGNQIDPATGRHFETPVDEVVADCGALLLAAEHGARATRRPYLDRTGGCPAHELELAHQIVTGAGARITSSAAASPTAIGTGAF